MQKLIEDLIKEKVLIIDGAMGTQLQAVDIDSKFWQYENKDLEGCNELLNLTAPHILETIYENYALAGAIFLAHSHEIFTLGRTGGPVIELALMYLLGSIAIMFIGSGKISIKS